MCILVWRVFLLATAFFSVAQNGVLSNRTSKSENIELLRSKRQLIEEKKEKCILPDVSKNGWYEISDVEDAGQSALDFLQAVECLKVDRKEACILPDYPENGYYKVTDIQGAGTGQSAKFFRLAVRCLEEYSVVDSDGRNGNGSFEVSCDEGKWSREMPECVRFCKLDPDPSVRYLCEAPGTETFKTCGKYIAPGAIVKPVCKRDYYSVSNFEDMMCENGTWDYVAKCKEECGRTYPQPEHDTDLRTGFTVNRAVKRGEAPWHVLIYHLTENPSCGGSIVSRTVVITGGFCFGPTSFPIPDYWVIANKLYNYWVDGRDDYSEMQWSKIKEVRILGSQKPSLLPNAIAIVKLRTPFTFNSHVRPLCLNFDKELIKENDFGMVVGFPTVKENEAERLQLLQMSIINLERCRKSVYPFVKEFITANVTCAGYITASSVMLPFMGSGFAVAQNESGIERYYLRGPSLQHFKCLKKVCVGNFLNYMSFANITMYEDDIKDYL